MRSAAGVKNNNLLFATIVTLKIANGTEHSVVLWHPPVASFSGTNGVGELGVEKCMSALRAAERKQFLTNPSDYCWLFPIKISAAM